MDQIMFYGKGVPLSDESTENYHPTLQFPSALQSIVASFSSFFWFLWPTALLFRLTLTALMTLFLAAAGSKKVLKPECTLPAQHQKAEGQATSC